jgi:hypothetical protein
VRGRIAGPPDTRSSSSWGVSLRSPETLASPSMRQASLDTLGLLAPLLRFVHAGSQ